MEYRKRARFEIVNDHNDDNHGLTIGCGTNNCDISSTTLASMNGQSYLLNGHQLAALGAAGEFTTETTATLPANILLTIYDANSEEESQEFIIDSSLLAQIKQEQNVTTQTSSLPAQQLPPIAQSISQSSSSTETNCSITLPAQYRLITNTNIHNNNNNNINSQQQHIGQHKPLGNNSNTIVLNTQSGCDKNMSTVATTAAANFLTNAIQLPTGCEVYLIKEFLDAPINCATSPTHMEITSNSDRININVNGEQISSTNTENNSARIKIEQGNIQELTTSNAANADQKLQQRQQQAIMTSCLKSNEQISPIRHCNNSVVNNDDITKRSFLLDTYKKRDDKRRATHNEVERRRRDKINSWIFKLKEMLPTDMNVLQHQKQQQKQHTIKNIHTSIAAITTTVMSSTTAAAKTATMTRLMSKSPQHASTRTPPNDSKSQILIKACEYIKNMQDEIKSLRQCLKDNENLRLCNDRLQEELYNLRNKMQYKDTEHEQKEFSSVAIGKNNSNTIIDKNCSNFALNALNCDITQEAIGTNATKTAINTIYSNTELHATTTAIKDSEFEMIKNEHQHHNHRQKQQQQQEEQKLYNIYNNNGLITTNTTTPDLTYKKRELILFTCSSS